MYTSTRKELNLTAQECILKGISDEGGLFICSNFKDFKFTEELINMNYQELAVYILKFFMPDFTEQELTEAVNLAYSKENFKDKIVDVKSFGKLSFLELFYGPTMAFKDMALTLLPHLMNISRKKLNKDKKTCILTATSGDTGGACLSGFMNEKDTKVVVLYPTNGVSEFQERQMHYYKGDNNYAIAIDGNFDDCQALVKEVFTTTKGLKNYELSSANSINIGRLIPQIVYYFYSYFELVRNKEIKYGEKINFVVPTGNFGNILACYIAKQMGLFIDKIVCASNENNVLTDFFETLTYDKNRDFHLTNSPAMDILVSSNLERLIYLISRGDYRLVGRLMTSLKTKGKFVLPENFKKRLTDFMACSVNNDNTINYIDFCYKRYNYLMDPHTAVAYGAYINLKDKLNGKTVVVSTASPFKFLDSVNLIFNKKEEGIDLAKAIAKETNLKVPDALINIYNQKVDKRCWNKDDMEELLRKFIGEIDEVR